MATASNSDIFELRICMKHMDPPIWRLVQVPSDYTFKQLHSVITNAMDWEGYLMHCFKVGKNEIGVIFSEEEYLDIGCKKLEEKCTKLSEFFRSPNDTIQYTYDLPSPWYFDIILEQILPRIPEQEYPCCVSGSGGSPPEDYTGSNDKKDWRTVKFDPKAIDFSYKTILFADSD